MKKVNNSFVLSLVLLAAISMLNSCTSKTGTPQVEFKVGAVAAENGSYTVSQEIPADSLVAEGTELTIKATPDAGYSLDCIYKTVAGSMWGTMSFEFFTPEVTLTVDKDMSIGATFVETSLVENINVTHDVVYAQPGVKPLKYDVFSPKGAKDLPCIIIIHGGGWSSNVEDIMRGLARELVKGGQYVVFSIDYRWINTGDGDEVPNTMNMLIEDVYGGIAHIMEHAAQYGGDPTRIAVTGDSAGGHLSASAATMIERIGDGGFTGEGGVYEYLPTYLPEGKTADEFKQELLAAMKAAAPSYGVFRGETLGNFVEGLAEEQVKAVSPIDNVPSASVRSVPHFLVRGTQDFLISDEEVQSYVDVLEAAGQRAEYVQVEGAGHAFFDWKPDARTRATFAEIGVPYAAQMKAFFDGVFYK